MSSAAMMETPDFKTNLPEQPRHRNAADHHSDKAAPAVWRSLLQLRLLVPYISRILPMLDVDLTTALAPAPLAPAPLAPSKTAPRPHELELSRSLAAELTRPLGELNRGFLDLQAGQHELRSQIGEQHNQLKRLDDHLLRLRESTARNAMEQQELAEDLRSASKLIRNLSAAMIALMIAVAAMVTFMLAHWR